jgi:anthranilate phosphoribosyltransferase
VSDRVRAALAAVVEGGSLSIEEARAAMGSVMDGEATPAQLAALLVALRMRGETVEELAGFAGAMRERVLHVDAPDGAIDVVGTGGDGSATFNISTAAALVVAAAGVPVAKHGNRAITSRSGSADVLDALGVRIDHDAESAAAELREHGFAFLFAPGFHPAMRHAGPTRREIGVRTAFNLVGPLTNPAGTRRQLIGVGDASAAPRIAAVAGLLGTERTIVVHGDGIDELPLDGTGVIHDVTPDGIERTRVDVVDLGLGPAPTSDLAGGTPVENAALVEGVLHGATGPRRDVVLLNAGAAFLAAGRVATIRAGIDLAVATIAAGRPIALLAGLRASRRAAEAARARAEESPAAAEEPRAAAEADRSSGAAAEAARARVR